MKVEVTYRPSPELQAALATLASPGNQRVIRRGLIRSALRVQTVAAREKIIGGGGKARTPPNPTRLTSRSGALRRSIRVDQGGLPFSIEIGSDLVYAAVHELGGSVSVPRHTVGEHTRTVVFGRKVKPFKVGPYAVSAHRATYPARPFIRPAIEDVTPEFPVIFAEEFRKELGL